MLTKKTTDVKNFGYFNEKRERKRETERERKRQKRQDNRLTERHKEKIFCEND